MLFHVISQKPNYIQLISKRQRTKQRLCERIALGQRITTPVRFHFNVPRETIAQSNRGRESEKKEIHLPRSSFPPETQYKELDLSLSTADRTTERSHARPPLASIIPGICPCTANHNVGRMGSTGSLNPAPTAFPRENKFAVIYPNGQSLVLSLTAFLWALHWCLRLSHNPHCTCCLTQNPRDECFTGAWRVFVCLPNKRQHNVL